MTIDRAASPFVAIAAVPSIVAALMGAWLTAAVLLVLPVAIALFFRDPARQSPADPRLVLAPADGTVMYAGEAKPGEAPPGAWRQVTIFLALWDVHINRVPVAGRVVRVEFSSGTKLPAFRPEASGNERSEIWIDHAGQPIVFRQVVGVLARRLVCRLKPGDEVDAGERMGLMKFGSRMDVFVPVTAVLTVTTGARVRAGETVIAQLG